LLDLQLQLGQAAFISTSPFISTSAWLLGIIEVLSVARQGLIFFFASQLACQSGGFVKSPASQRPPSLPSPLTVHFGMSDTEEGRNEDVAISMRERILAILGTDYGKKIDGMVFDMDRLADSKPALLMDNDISFEKLERFAPPGIIIGSPVHFLLKNSQPL
jgi:hypothetical protein